jgi:hypothetical protein
MGRSVVYLFPVLLLVGGCSVYMAASKEGVDIETLGQCKLRACLIGDGAKPLKTANLPPNTEVFKVLKPHGSTTRAVMNGLLDVATFGVWEIAGTPIEGSFDRNKYYLIRISYIPGTQNIKEMALAR